MVKKQAHLLFMTYQTKEGGPEKVAYPEISYDKTMQLPLQWKLDRCGTFVSECVRAGLLTTWSL
jgi:hypothetical protein